MKLKQAPLPLLKKPALPIAIGMPTGHLPSSKLNLKADW